MRFIEFNELNLKENYTEDEFLQIYIKTLPKEKSKKTTIPHKKYEIFWLNIFNGKIILLNKKHIKKTDITNQELYYNYNIAYQIYNNLLDIYDGLTAETSDINELYLTERLEKDNIINKLKQKDNELFEKDLAEYNKAQEANELTLQPQDKKLNFIQKILQKIFKFGGNKWYKP